MEDFLFPYKSIMDKEINIGNLKKKYDVIILPHDLPEMIKGVIIGRDFGKQINARNAVLERITLFDKLYSLDCYTYHVTEKEITFEKFNITTGVIKHA